VCEKKTVKAKHITNILTMRKGLHIHLSKRFGCTSLVLCCHYYL